MCLVGLKHVAAAEGSEDTEDREQDRKDLAHGQATLLESLGEIIHRPARDGPVRIFVPVFHTQRALGEFRCHPQKPSKDQPEGRPRTADADGNRNTGDIAKAHRARQRCRQRLEVADLARVVGVGIIAFHQCDGMTEGAKLNEPEINGKDGRRDDQPADDPRETGSGKRRKDQVHEPSGRGCEDRIDLFVDALRHDRHCRDRRAKCRQSQYLDLGIHDVTPSGITERS